MATQIKKYNLTKIQKSTLTYYYIHVLSRIYLFHFTFQIFQEMLKFSRLSLKGNYPRFQQRHPAIMLDMVKNNSQSQFHFQTKDLGEWSQKNERLYKPVSLNRHGIQENLRPAEVYHGRIRIRMSPKNMAHAAWFVRNIKSW